MKLIDDTSRRWKIAINVLVLILALVRVTRRDAAFQQTSAFENLMIDSFAPIQKSVTYFQKSIASIFEHYFANVDASQDNVALNKEIHNLKEQIFSYEELGKENKRLKDLLQFGTESKRNKVLAQVVAWDSNSDFRVIRINKGSQDGIRLQSTVVTAEGLVGYIYRMTDSFSDILTITDSNNRVDVLIERIRAHGILEGFTSTRTLMKYVTRTEPVILGDTILTSGLGDIYPKGIKVGTVSRIERESYGITQDVEVTPSADFGRLEEVIVLINEFDEKKKQEWSALDKGEEGDK